MINKKSLCHYLGAGWQPKENSNYNPRVHNKAQQLTKIQTTSHEAIGIQSEETELHKENFCFQVNINQCNKVNRRINIRLNVTV